MTRGIWRDFTLGVQVGNKNKAMIHQITDDSIAIIGGKDEVRKY